MPRSGLLLAALVGAALGCASDAKPGVVQGECRTRFVSGVPGDPNPVGPWEPLANLRITAMDETQREVGAATSGPDGHYRLSLPPGRYTLFGVRENTRHPPARVGGQESPDNRGVVEVRAGGVVEVDFDVLTFGS
jgi:hypothetical protein